MICFQNNVWSQIKPAWASTNKQLASMSTNGTTNTAAVVHSYLLALDQELYYYFAVSVTFLLCAICLDYINGEIYNIDQILCCFNHRYTFNAVLTHEPVEIGASGYMHTAWMCNDAAAVKDEVMQRRYSAACSRICGGHDAPCIQVFMR